MKRFTKISKRINQNRLGASAVEFALVLPLMFILMFTMFETSRYLMGLQATTGAAREAAKIYSVNRDLESARTVARDFMTNSSFHVDTIQVAIDELNSDVPDKEIISCTVEIDYSEVSILGDPFRLNTLSVPGFAAIMADED